MKWNYQIIKDGDEYFLAMVYDKESYAEILDTRSSSLEDLKADLLLRLVDSHSHKVLEIKNGKIKIK